MKSAYLKRICALIEKEMKQDRLFEKKFRVRYPKEAVEKELILGMTRETSEEERDRVESRVHDKI